MDCMESCNRFKKKGQGRFYRWCVQECDKNLDRCRQGLAEEREGPFH